jgi:predicted nucleotidyltransferase
MKNSHNVGRPYNSRRDLAGNLLLNHLRDMLEAVSFMQDLQTLASELQAIFEKHHVLRAIVFGSLGPGEASRHSDLDLIVVQETPKRFLDRYDELLREIVQAVPGRDVDPLIYTPQELAQIAHRPLIATALKEGKVIYASEQEPV